MHYQLSTTRPTVARLVEVFDMAVFADFVASDQINLADDVIYITEDGVVERHSGYTVLPRDADSLLVRLDDGTLAVTSRRGLRVYAGMTGQILPVELRS